MAPAPDSQWEVTDGLRLALPTFTHPSQLARRGLTPLDQLLSLEGPWVGGKGRSGQGTGHPDAPREGRRVRPNMVIYWSVMVCGRWFVEVKSISCRSQVLSIITAISQVKASEQVYGGWGLILDGHYPWCPPFQPSYSGSRCATLRLQNLGEHSWLPPSQVAEVEPDCEPPGLETGPALLLKASLCWPRCRHVLPIPIPPLMRSDTTPTRNYSVANVYGTHFSFCKQI